ncbi:MAG: phosphonate C-P lyase system protein PhnG [Cyanobacteria bacterium J06576_12]
MSEQQSARQIWMGTLAKAPINRLEALTGQLEAVPEYQFLRSPETGLTMVRGRAGGVGQVFNLGEMTLTRCVVQLAGGANGEETITGFGYVGGRSHRHAELAALCDGLMQHQDWHARVQKIVIEPLQEIAHQASEQKQQQTASTKVDFFTLLRGE